VPDFIVAPRRFIGLWLAKQRAPDVSYATYAVSIAAPSHMLSA